MNEVVDKKEKSINEDVRSSITNCKEALDILAGLELIINRIDNKRPSAPKDKCDEKNPERPFEELCLGEKISLTRLITRKVTIRCDELARLLDSII
jgi:hypothetical protein